MGRFKLQILIGKITAQNNYENKLPNNKNIYNVKHYYHTTF